MANPADKNLKKEVGKDKAESLDTIVPEGADDNSARGRILDAAIKLFVSQGLEGTSTRDIAKASGLNISLISYYFGGKEGLYKAVLENFAEAARHEMERFFAMYSNESMTRERFTRQMKEMIKLTIALKMKHPSIFLLLQREAMAGMPYARDIIEHKFDMMIGKIAGLYKEGQAQGFVRKDINPHIVFLSLVHSSDSYMQFSKCAVGGLMANIYKLPEQIDLYIDQLHKIFVEGVMV